MEELRNLWGFGDSVCDVVVTVGEVTVVVCGPKWVTEMPCPAVVELVVVVE